MIYTHPPEPLWEVVPTNVAHNITFLLNSTACKCDDMEAWGNNGVKQNAFNLYKEEVKAMKTEEGNLARGRIYTLVRMYNKNKTCSDVKKFVSFLEGRLCLSTYFFYFYPYVFYRGQKHNNHPVPLQCYTYHNVTPKPHGNCRQEQTTRCIRTKPSVCERVKKVSEHSPPKRTFH